MPTSGEKSTVKVICHSAMMTKVIKSSLEDVGFTVSSTCGDCEEECLSEHAGVTVIVSGFCGDPASLPCLRKLTQETGETCIVMTSLPSDPIVLFLGLAGIDVCTVPDNIDGDDLANVVNLAAKGYRMTMGKFCKTCSTEDLRKINEAKLDDQQWRILRYLMDGESNKIIAHRENASEAAIKGKIRALLEKLNVENRTQAAVIAVRAMVFPDNKNFDKAA